MKTKGVFILLSAVLIGGCVPSLHELYTQDTLVYDEAFVGKFQEGTQVWEFVGDPEDKSYKLTIHEKKDVKSEFKAHLVNLQGQLFFDLFPTGEIEAGDYTEMHLVPAHLFWKVNKTDAGFTLAVMGDGFGQLLEDDPKVVKHEQLKDEDGKDERIVLTDSPENLQKLLIKGLQIEDFFGEPGEFKRLPAETDIFLAP